MKLHVGCGDIYLSRYKNLDLKGILAGPNHVGTTLDKYYTRPFREALGNKRDFVIDIQMDILKPWKFEDNSVSEVVIISVIEHFTKFDALIILRESYRVLEPGGRIIIDFPDVRKDVEDYYTSDPEFLMELLYCNQKDNLSQHKWGYTKETFIDTLGPRWDVSFETIVTHAYPMIGAICTKLGT